MTESTGSSYGKLLKKTQDLYIKHGKTFSPSNKKGYANLEKVLSSKSQILYFIVRKTKPNVVVETGVAAGESTGFLLQALSDNKKGTLHSIDLPFQWYVYGEQDELHLDSLPPGKMPGYLVPEKLKNRWNLILGDTYKKLPRLLSSLKKVDIFLHDSEHTDKTMLFEYKQAWPKIKKAGYLLSDDIDFTDAFQTFSKSKSKDFIDFKKLGIIPRGK